MLVEDRYRDGVLELFQLQFLEVLLLWAHQSLSLALRVGTIRVSFLIATAIDVLLNEDSSVGEGIARQAEVRAHSDGVYSKLANDLIGLGTYAVQMVNVLVVHEEYDAFGLEDAHAQLVDLRDHWNEERVKGLVHQALNIPQLLI